ncbi:MAG TPA: GtrA family protein [Rhizomicrobium sp.]|nr:GtrA family protein [Rhizomicrobium sp.]
MSRLLATLQQSRFFRFLIVGGFGFLVAESVLWLAIHGAHANSSVAWLISFLAAVTFTWWGNRNLTFADQKATGSGGITSEYVRFFLSNAIGGAVNFAVFKSIEAYAPPPANDPVVALACGVLAGLVFNFTMSKLVVFKS